MLVPMSAPQQQLYADTLAKIAAQALERQKAWEAEGGEGAEGLGAIDLPSSRHRGEGAGRPPRRRAEEVGACRLHRATQGHAAPAARCTLALTPHP